jgi:hypothetical protein
MMFFAIRIEHPLNVAVQGPHYADPRKHRRAAVRRDQYQGLHSRLPFRGLVLGLWQLGDVLAGVFKRDELTAAQ